MVLNAYFWLAKTNTQNLHTILYVFCLYQWLVQCCADKPTWRCIPQLFATFEPWRRHLRRVTSAKGSQKSEFYMLAFDWLEQTVGAIFSLREWLVQSYGARLFGNTFLNFVSNFSLEGGKGVICLCHWQHHISKMGYFKCTI